MHEKNDCNPERCVEVAEDKTEHSEECFHRREDHVNEQTIGPETSSRPVGACHEVDGDDVDENLSRGEGNIRERVGDGVGRSLVHTVTRTRVGAIAISEGSIPQLTGLFKIPVRVRASDEIVGCTLVWKT